MTDSNLTFLPEGYPSDNILTQAPVSVVISDPHQPDNPIVFVNRAFEQTTGYSRLFVLGKNCRFLQGEDTDPTAVGIIRDALKEVREVTVTLKNYRADGSSFWNELRLTPIYDVNGALIYFLGLQRVVPTPEGKTAGAVAQDLMLQEIQHRVKNHLAMIVSLIRSQASLPNPAGSEGFINLARRVEALQLLYEHLHPEPTKRESLDIGAYTGQIVSGVMQVNPSRTVRVNVHTDSADVSVDLAVRVGLILSELLTNSLQHAFVDADKGLVNVSVTTELVEDQKILRLVVADNGAGFDMQGNWPETGGSGSKIIKGMTEFSNATIKARSDSSGTEIEIDFPFEALQTPFGG